MSQSDNLLQLDIDFLPARYREECAQRKSHFWRLVGAGVFALVLFACSGWQWHAKRTLALELDAITPIHETAHERTVQMTTLKNELATAQERAELLTYFRHPWPKTQLVAAVIEPMPKSIKISELYIGRQEDETTQSVLPSQMARNRSSAPTDVGEKKAKLTPTQEDLQQLRGEFDPASTVINMAGETTNVSELHEYLGELSRHPLILKAELRSIESARESATTAFRARIVVRPGYGQPGGPVRKETPAAPAKQAEPVLQQALRRNLGEPIGS